MNRLDELEEIVRRHVRRPDLDRCLELLEEERGLRVALVPVLAALREDGPCTARRVAQLTGVLVPPGRRLSELERRGLVGRLPGATPGRPGRWWLTPAGAARLATAEGS
jgi:DNA-binding MarR family transcriptional regulator